MVNEAERLKLLSQAVKDHWTTSELETRVRSFNAVALASADQDASFDGRVAHAASRHARTAPDRRPRLGSRGRSRSQILPCTRSRKISTAAGRAAKAFADELIRAGDDVVMSTTKPDKYDRYLADVFVVPAEAANSEPRADDSWLFLNNALLQNGHAVRYDGGAKEE